MDGNGIPYAAAMAEFGYGGSKRCCECDDGAKIECLLCLKEGVRPPPCFCSKLCYEHHWKIHKKHGLASGKHRSKSVPHFAAGGGHAMHPMVLSPSRSAFDIHLEHEGAKYYTAAECHSLDAANNNNASVMPRHAFHPGQGTLGSYAWRSYLVSAATNQSHHHE